MQISQRALYFASTLGRILAKKDEHHKAFEVYKEGLKKNSTGSWLRIGMGDLYKKIGDSHNAALEYEKALYGYDKSFLYGLIDSLMIYHKVESELNENLRH